MAYDDIYETKPLSIRAVKYTGKEDAKKVSDFIRSIFDPDKQFDIDGYINQNEDLYIVIKSIGVWDIHKNYYGVYLDNRKDALTFIPTEEFETVFMKKENNNEP